ncbi:MAG: protease modulator HflC [Rhodobiaceae bacterium]|nr:protease modulator HflC [Rhodobiaceae bacterium]MCC0055705.1 protease modulator HflC [Rhodobiaceae bacterium]
MKTGIFGGIIVLLIAVGFLAYNSLFVVSQTDQALVLQFGEHKRTVRTPGLNFKLPFVQNVVFLDKRILDLDSPVQEVIASDQKRLVVDAFARYRIADPLRFYQSIGTVTVANSRLATVLNASLRRVLGNATFEDVVRDERPNLMSQINTEVNREAEKFGISVVDVRIRRADLPEANSQAIYDRMQTERQQEAAEIRARGAEAAQRIRAKSDRDVAVVIAEANQQSEEIRGVGDATRADVFAAAYGRDPEFFAFYRSMLAYEKSLGGDTRLVMSPDSPFFRYFVNPVGPGAPASPQRPAQ